ncbi:pyridoxamine 5'-phosphate oxidase family protein [uncultured Cohaesibacter sp.]|uniref:pyridoxamine 5'-phosphate oxidase family protein n=1 Tax=uncultured Cohaesibacter sp. TaxID=1002546 RepID=UPI0029C7B546|nr:pyridoxamine 5'-phosphate oxidase family protein [uncultured Cohaesibacter sp.]
MTGLNPSDIAFSDSIKQVQSEKGSRDFYARMGETQPWSSRITPELGRFISDQTSVFFGTASRTGQPYIQHRGGPAGFLHILSDRQIGFADLAGNRQYITIGNLTENPWAFLFLIDYEHSRRIKLWGTAEVVEGDPDLMKRLVVKEQRGRPERAILFTLEAWDINCPQYIPQRLDIARVDTMLAERDLRIHELEAELALLKA